MDSATFIKELGGTGAVAAHLGLKQNRVSNWQERGIPWMYRPKLAELAKRQRVEVPKDFLEPASAP